MTDRRSWTSGWSPAAPPPARVIHRLYEELRTPDTAFVVATGYGRALLPEADKSITEITCHGAGAAFLCPGCDTVIDIGGQDSKVILLDPSGGQVKDFLMNDKCAAGTGRFLEMNHEPGRQRDHLHRYLCGGAGAGDHQQYVRRVC